MNGLASLYPPPPPYFRHYSSENVKKVNEWVKEHGEDTEGCPEEIKALLPPPAPAPPQQSYRNFGSIWNVVEQLPSLESSGIPQLYAPGSEKSTPQLTAELKKLLRGALLNYVSLVQTLIVNPEQFGVSVDRLRTVLINMHHLLNTYRPLQSQETLVLRMEDQIAKCKKEAEEMRATNQRIRSRLNELETMLKSQSLPEPQADADGSVWEGFDLDIDVHQTPALNSAPNAATEDNSAVMDVEV